MVHPMTLTMVFPMIFLMILPMILPMTLPAHQAEGWGGWEDSIIGLDSLPPCLYIYSLYKLFIDHEKEIKKLRKKYIKVSLKL